MAGFYAWVGELAQRGRVVTRGGRAPVDLGVVLAARDAQRDAAVHRDRIAVDGLARGDDAVVHYTETFDGLKLTAETLRIPPDEIEQDVQSTVDHLYNTKLHGTPEEVKEKIGKLAEETQADEIMLNFPIADLNAKLNSMQLIGPVR